MPESSHPCTQPERKRPGSLFKALIFALAALCLILALTWVALPHLARNVLVPIKVYIISSFFIYFS